MIANLRQTLVNSALKYVGVTGGSDPGDDIFISYYNQLTGTRFSVSTTAWCAIFMTFILRTNGIPTSICPNFASCTSVRNSFLKPKGYWKLKGEYTPQAGDLIFFDWTNTGNNLLDHVGMVEKVANGKVYTVEGNTKGGYSKSGVRHKSYSLTSSYIVGYGALPYESITALSTFPDPNNLNGPVTNPIKKSSKYVKTYQKWMNHYFKTGIDEDGYYGPATRKASIIALRNIIKIEHGKNVAIDSTFPTALADMIPQVYKNKRGNLVYIAQGMLYCNGYDPNGLDSICGSGMDRAIRRFQAYYGLKVDGYIGPATWTKLYKKV